MFGLFEKATTIFTVFGAAWLIKRIFYLLRIFYVHFRNLSTSLEKYKNPDTEKVNFAVITGSTDGIGKGYAMVLAKYGFNII